MVAFLAHYQDDSSLILRWVNVVYVCLCTAIQYCVPIGWSIWEMQTLCYHGPRSWFYLEFFFLSSLDTWCKISFPLNGANLASCGCILLYCIIAHEIGFLQCIMAEKYESRKSSLSQRSLPGSSGRKHRAKMWWIPETAVLTRLSKCQRCSPCDLCRNVQQYRRA